jgi:hypothetical protein
MRKRLVPAVGVLACLGLVGLVVVPRLLSPGPGVTPANFHRLRLGMTEQEVEAIFGGRGEDQIFVRRRGPDRYWVDEHCQVSVWFSDGRVAWAILLDKDDRHMELLCDDSTSFWDRVRRLLPG